MCLLQWCIASFSILPNTISVIQLYKTLTSTNVYIIYCLFTLSSWGRWQQMLMGPRTYQVLWFEWTIPFYHKDTIVSLLTIHQLLLLWSVDWCLWLYMTCSQNYHDVIMATINNCCTKWIGWKSKIRIFLMLVWWHTHILCIYLILVKRLVLVLVHPVCSSTSTVKDL